MHEIKDIYRPKHWDFTKLKYDLAIVTVKTPFIFNEKVQPIKLDFRSSTVNKLKGEILKVLKNLRLK